MYEIKKLISIGANCIGTDIIHFSGLRVPSPVDNFSGFNIWKSHLLFNNELKHSLFREDYESRPSTTVEQKKYWYYSRVFTFNHNYMIVHNDFEDLKFKKSVKKRLNLFKGYYQLSKKESSLWYVYSLDESDKDIDENFMKEIILNLPDCCKNRLICIGMRGKNFLFEKYFRYYLEFDESTYYWNSEIQAKKILKRYEEAFDLKFNMECK
ncbi:MAG: hypothetical protein HUK25_04170 [Treponema sp.]|nr:hypothetical protein [Clostridia bacterium]MCF0241807.1 hypothetical protein [Treponema sp.]